MSKKSKHRCTHSTYRARNEHWLAITAVCSLSLVACGSAEEPSGGQSEPTQPAVQTPIMDSTAIAVHQVNNDFEFDQYRTVTITLDLYTYASQVIGDYFVIKVYGDDQTYFLGSRDSLGTLEVRISVPRHVGRLWLLVFSNDSHGGEVKEEIVL